MNVINLWSPKGGTGCSTIAAAWAAIASFGGETILVDAATGDLPAICGIPEWGADGIVPVTRTLQLIPRGHDRADLEGTFERAEAVVIDWGTTPPSSSASPGRLIAVLEPSYVCLQRWMKADHLARSDGAILCMADDGPLGVDDVAHAIAPVPIIATIPRDVTVRRAVSAGMLVARIPTVLREAIPK
jgi:septum formation inhibitor-activating ATPase MinD